MRYRVRRQIAMKKHVLDMRGKFFKRCFEIEAVRVVDELEGALENRGPGAWAKAAIEDRARPISNNPGGIEIVFRAEAIAGGERSIGRIEAQRTRLRRSRRNATGRTMRVFA